MGTAEMIFGRWGVGMDMGHGGCGGEMVVGKALERESKGAGGGLRGLWGGGERRSFMLVERGKDFQNKAPVVDSPLIPI